MLLAPNSGGPQGLPETALLAHGFPMGCSPHTTYVDAEHHDTHRWDDHESALYAQWEQETQRAHLDFERRNDAGKKAYWDWRHRH